MPTCNRKIFFMMSCLLAVIVVCTGCTKKKEELHLQGIAMTIPYHIIVEDGKSNEENAKNIVIHTFEEVDSVFNKWNPESEISLLNQWSTSKPFKCSPELFSMLTQCERFFTVTQGRFDPTVEPLEQLWKTALDNGVLPQQEDIDALRPALGWERIHLHNGTVIKEHPKTALDFGGVAKGHAVDLLVERLAKAGFTSVYVEWGGEIRTQGSHPDGRPWRVGIRHPHKENTVLQVLEVEDVALATSGDYHQY
jgi:thiamine biosynthesis lipoprotein